MKPVLTIICPVFNHLEYTKQFVSSLIECTDQYYLDRIEVWFINNGSWDGTTQYLDNLAKSGGPFLPYHNKENKGWTGAINDFLGMKAVSSDMIFNIIHSDFVLLANNDILFEKEWFPKMMKRFNDPQVGIIGPTSDYVSGLQSIIHNLPGVVTESSKFLIGFFFMLRTKLFHELGLFDEKTFGRLGGGEELDFCIRAREAGYQLKICRDVFIKHFGSKTLSGEIGGGPLSKEYETFHLKKEKELADKWGKDFTQDLYTVDVADRLKVCVMIPMRTSYSGHVDFWFSMLCLQKPGIFNAVVCKRRFISDARNILIQDALKYGCTHVLFTDDDHTFPPDALVRLLNHDVDIVGALAFKREEPFDPCTFMTVDFNGVKGLVSEYRCEEGLQEFDAVGFAFILIKIDVFKKMNWPYFVYGDTSLGYAEKLGGLSEDIGFCVKARQLGYKVYCDTDLEAPHIGDEIRVNSGTYKAYKAAKEKENATAP